MVQRKVIVRGATNQALDELDATDIPDLSASYEAAGGIATHAADTSSVHGIADTTVLATDAEVATAVSDHAAAANPHPTYETSAEAQAKVDAHEADTTAVHGIADTSALSLTSHDHDADYEATGAVATHAGLADPHTGYRLESADHSHASAGLQGGTVAHSALTGLTTGDDHTQYLLEADANYVDLTDGGATVLHNHTTSRNVSAANQTVAANTVTYITGSGILIPAAGFVVGQVYRWYIAVNKTAAGTATPVWTFRVGTNQTTGDATYLTITGTAQVATLSGTLIEIVAFVRTVSATVGIITAGINTGAASFGIGGSAVSGNLNNGSDAGKRFGLCVNTGASAAWTVNSVMGEQV